MEKRKVLKEIKLSDGRIAQIVEGKGKDLFWAQRNATDPTDITTLLLVRLTRIDNEPITEEVLEELPLQDTMALIKAFTELYSPLLAETQS